MLNKLESFIGQYQLISSGERVICAVSGGADSMALLMAMYLLRDKLGILLEAAHFNHGLRGEESDTDETFVRDFCSRLDIPCHFGKAQVCPGKKGLEAAARDSRYRFLESLGGKIATAHTADDNAETILMHLIRGTGLKGLGGITPKRGNIIRPMLNITREQVLCFLDEYHVRYRNDSSNDTDLFLRNRLRHHVMPLLQQENPRLSENLSAMALRLRQDEEALQSYANMDYPLNVHRLRNLTPAIRSRVIDRFLKDCGVKEPEAEHRLLAESLVFSQRPSAFARFPGNVELYRQYDLLLCRQHDTVPEETTLSCPGTANFGDYALVCKEATSIVNTPNVFTVSDCGDILIRSRRIGDKLRTSGGTKSLKKLYIDRKIPCGQRSLLPVLEDEKGILAACGIGADSRRMASELPAWQITVINQSQNDLKENEHAG